MSKKVNEKGLASGKRCLAFFLREGFEATVCQIPYQETQPPALALFLSQDGVLRPNGNSQVRYSIRSRSWPMPKRIVRLTTDEADKNGWEPSCGRKSAGRCGCFFPATCSEPFS
jgi:hypothetical protein